MGTYGQAISDKEVLELEDRNTSHLVSSFLALLSSCFKKEFSLMFFEEAAQTGKKTWYIFCPTIRWLVVHLISGLLASSQALLAGPLACMAESQARLTGFQAKLAGPPACLADLLACPAGLLAWLAGLQAKKWVAGGRTYGWRYRWKITSFYSRLSPIGATALKKHCRGQLVD